MNAADALLAEINAAVQEDDAEAITSLLAQLREVEPATADIVAKVLFAFDEAQS